MIDEAQAKAQQDQRLNDMRELMGDGAGRRHLLQLLEVNCLFKPTFTGNANGYYLEGKRNAALDVLRDMVAADKEAAARILVDLLTEEEEEVRSE